MTEAKPAKFHEEVIIDVRRNARIRQLVDGRWVGEICGWFGWSALCTRHTGVARSRGDSLFDYCIVDTAEQALTVLATYGI